MGRQLKVSTLNHFHWISHQNPRTAALAGMFQSGQMPIFLISDVNNRCMEKSHEHYYVGKVTPGQEPEDKILNHYSAILSPCVLEPRYTDF